MSFPPFAALATYARSPTAYEALRGFGILQLPCVSSLKGFTGFNLEAPGFCEERLSYARQQYDRLVESKRASHQPPPFSEGILIFDEVKVGVKVQYHAKAGRFLGLAMSLDELGSLHDVYQQLQPDHRSQTTSYILQYLWRDTASDFDIIGPYFTSAGSLKAKFVLATLYEVMYAFHSYGFKVKATLCDGASVNLCVIKLLTGFGSGAFGVGDATSPDRQEVKCWFLNPHTNEKVYTLICPSHQECQNMHIIRDLQ